MSIDIEPCHILFDMLINNKKQIKSMEILQFAHYNNVKGVFRFMELKPSDGINLYGGIKFITHDKLSEYFPQKEIVDMLIKRISASDPNKNFVLGVVTYDRTSYFSNVTWEGTEIKIEGL